MLFMIFPEPGTHLASRRARETSEGMCEWSVNGWARSGHPWARLGAQAVPLPVFDGLTDSTLVASVWGAAGHGMPARRWSPQHQTRDLWDGPDDPEAESRDRQRQDAGTFWQGPELPTHSFLPGHSATLTGLLPWGTIYEALRTMHGTQQMVNKC